MHKLGTVDHSGRLRSAQLLPQPAERKQIMQEADKTSLVCNPAPFIFLMVFERPFLHCNFQVPQYLDLIYTSFMNIGNHYHYL